MPLDDLKKLIEEAFKDDSTVRARVFGNGGIIDSAFKEAKKNNPKVLKEISELRLYYMNLYDAKFSAKNKIDSTIPCYQDFGKIHPLSQTIEETRNIMISHGLTEVKSSCIEDEWHNFDGLNVDKFHPARRSHDTFYVPGGLLSTQTTATDIRMMETGQLHPPFGFFTIGSVFRRDEDSTHSPVFHQVDVLIVRDGLEIGHLKYVLHSFFSSFFNSDVDIRLRPSYFPFTEPSMEVDIMFSNNKNKSSGNWLEIAGSGMLRKNILSRYGFGDYNGVAFAIGIDRICMVKYGIDNINDLYRNRYPFLEKFGIDLYNFEGV